MPASSAESENVDQESVTSLLGTAPGSTLELPAASVTAAPKRSLCVKRLRISAPAALKFAVPGRVLRERRRRKRRRLVGKPGRAVDQFCALVRAAPGTHHLAAEECANRRDGTNGVERTLVVPRATAGVGDRVRESEEELHVSLEAVFVVSVVVAARHDLREQIPMSGRELRAG